MSAYLRIGSSWRLVAEAAFLVVVPLVYAQLIVIPLGTFSIYWLAIGLAQLLRLPRPLLSGFGALNWLRILILSAICLVTVFAGSFPPDALLILLGNLLLLESLYQVIFEESGSDPGNPPNEKS
jgi:hypothetical protein